MVLKFITVAVRGSREEVCCFSSDKFMCYIMMTPLVEVE